MLNLFKKKIYLDWNDYEEEIQRLEILNWHRNKRKNSIENTHIDN